jgi:hypothetical protein
MPTAAAERTLDDIKGLSSDDLSWLCTTLVATLSDLTRGAFEVRTGSEMRAKRAFFKLVMKRQADQVGPAGVRVVEEMLAREGQVARLVTESAALARAYRDDARAAQSKENRRRRRPDESTTKVLDRVARLVGTYSRRGEPVDWVAITAKVRMAFDNRVYNPDALKGMYYRALRRGRVGTTT